MKPKKMIKSAIFEANKLNMSPKSILLLVSLFLIGLQVTGQYTDKINTNRPGTSQGAFSVGNNVLQIEGGLGLGKENHQLFKTKTTAFNVDYEIRYGLLMEQLEIRLNGKLRSDAVRQTVGATEEKINRTAFEVNTIGAKYLIYDPYKKPRVKDDSLKLEKLKSWKKTYGFSWRSLIPAVSAYAGMNFMSADNPFTFPNDPSISPKFVIATQNNWYNANAGSWVLVTNFIVDKITTDTPLYGWIITSTHTVNDHWAVFAEYQGQKSDFYSDDIVRLGTAYLFNKDFQIDANIATNFKDTPSLLVVSAGASYRFDWHKKDEIIEEPGLEKFENEEDIEEKEIEGDEEREVEEIESDSLKQGKQPFINEFEDDNFRDTMEGDLDERRTEEREERERIASEKQSKKDSKKFAKEERRRLKREAKEAKKKEKEKIKAQKEKQKMIEEIDAELNKMEEGEIDELQQIEEELKLLEEPDPDLTVKKEEKETEQKEKAEEEDVDAAYDQLQKDQEKAKKEEEKRQKAEEKKRLKEEKKRKKQEEKRRKAEEKENND